MGDLVQSLPALTDAAKAIPTIRFDWVVNESFAQVPSWHPAVDTVIGSDYHGWGGNLRGSLKARVPQAFLKKLRARKYDLIVDLQGEFKSALTARLAKGVRTGYDARSVHERGAHLTYQQRFAVPKGQHSIKRMRRLLSLALRYEYQESDVDYGIDRSRLPSSSLSIDPPYVVFIHSTSWSSKNWPEDFWRELTKAATAAGVTVVLPWGDESERQRAVRIAQDNGRAVVLPQLTISEKAAIIAGARATVGLDTGLSHIAAALDVPSVTIYGATDPLLVGATGRHQFHLTSEFECVRCHEHECGYQGPAKFKPACFVEITPEKVWERLTSLVS
jgi:heptosyltransferase-1